MVRARLALVLALALPLGGCSDAPHWLVVVIAKMTRFLSPRVDPRLEPRTHIPADCVEIEDGWPDLRHRPNRAVDVSHSQIRAGVAFHRRYDCPVSHRWMLPENDSPPEAGSRLPALWALCREPQRTPCRFGAMAFRP